MKLFSILTIKLFLQSYKNDNMASRIIYEWGTCKGSISRYKLKIVNVEILQHVKILVAIGIVYVLVIVVCKTTTSIQNKELRCVRQRAEIS
jgi:hypothetical protein